MNNGQEKNEDVPEADETGGFDDEDVSIENEEEICDEVLDLDDDIPEADNSWAYDRTSDTQSEPPSSAFAARRMRIGSVPQSSQLNMQSSPGDPVRPRPGQEYSDEEEADLDNDIPDMDAEGQDLDDEIPEAEDDEGWEHTDTELEESEMDISIMPPGVTANRSMPPPASTMSRQARQHNTRHSTASEISDSGRGMRRTSGNIPLPNQPAPRFPISGRGIALVNQRTPNFAPDQLGSDFSVSALISTGNTDMTSEMNSQTQRNWPVPANTRRNLFGVARNDSRPLSQPVRNMDDDRQSQNIPQQDGAGHAPRQLSSGGLFTPSPQLNTQRQPSNSTFEEPQSRTRSGRVLGRGARGGRA